jgi:transposase
VDQIILQQNNDPKHTCKRAREWCQKKDMEVLIWPAQSPELNPIEHLWEFVKKTLNEYPEASKGILELWEKMQVEWEKIPRETCQKLISSMPDRVRAV